MTFLTEMSFDLVTEYFKKSFTLQFIAHYSQHSQGRKMEINNSVEERYFIIEDNYNFKLHRRLRRELTWENKKMGSGGKIKIKKKKTFPQRCQWIIVLNEMLLIYSLGSRIEGD